MSHSFVDAQIRGHLAAIVAAGLETEEGDKRIKALFATYTEPGLSRVLTKSENGRAVLRRSKMMAITTW